MNNIYIVGFMASGKTSVSKELARRKKWQFLDLDDFIESREKMRIADIFAKKGEPYFRKIEKQALKEVAKEKKFIVACGGGIVLDKDNIKIMKATGIVYCLDVPAHEVLKRTAGTTHRPLLNVSSPKEKIELLLKMRAPFYAQADKTINTANLSVKEVADKIIKLIAKKR